MLQVRRLGSDGAQLAGHLHLSVTQRYAHTHDNLKKDAVQVFTRRSA
ncbi:hypothetical protein WME97_43815 [Sorangium sp. So ce367]